jgi:hypothetical protein
MTDLQLSITAAQRKYLVDLLEKVLKDMSIEEHRTRTPTYRQHILEQENLIGQLLEKLRQPPA